ncbi:MAG TPA: hypothetical protein ENI85_08515 [Deltaproteobacteria bacterium]|nr:hypothetical protein [Deltaproteobacteria bacterium]
MSAGGERAAIEALKSAFPTEAVFLARGIHEKPAAYRDLVSATTLAGAIRSVIGLGEHVIVHEIPDGGVSSIGREGMMNELPARAMARFFEPIARFVEPGSFIQFESDHGGAWTRIEFNNGVLRVVECELGADELGDWGVIEHDRTEVLLDPTL